MQLPIRNLRAGYLKVRPELKRVSLPHAPDQSEDLRREPRSGGSRGDGPAWQGAGLLILW